MNFHKMIISDYDGIYELWINTPGMGLNTVDDSKDGIARYLKRNTNTCFVAEKNAEIIGVIISGHDGRRGYIYHMAVSLSERKKGIGQRLLDMSMSALQFEGINKVALVVFSGNDIGNAFWENRGFIAREDLNYRNKNIIELTRIDT